MSWLVTGGAGYIGSHVVRALLDAGLDAVVYDDLSTGRREYVQAGARFIEGSIHDTALLQGTMAAHGVTGVIHTAGMKFAGLSVAEPLYAYRLNVDGTRSVLDAMVGAGVGAIVFSSSCAVYGTPAADAVDETTTPAPESPYGRSKLVAEWVLRDAAAAKGVRQVSLRYFNVIGASAPGVWDSSPRNLLPLVYEALRTGRSPRINGDDYPTPDGTCIRDYVHVADIAAAHVTAALALERGETLPEGINLGSGTGSSVREIMDAVRDATGIDVQPEVGPRRAGDPARIIAKAQLAAEVLGWVPTRDLAESVRSGWAAHKGIADAGVTGMGAAGATGATG